MPFEYKPGERDPRYGGIVTDIATLPVGTTFEVRNGCWWGKIVEVSCTRWLLSSDSPFPEPGSPEYGTYKAKSRVPVQPAGDENNLLSLANVKYPPDAKRFAWRERHCHDQGFAVAAISDILELAGGAVVEVAYPHQGKPTIPELRLYRHGEVLYKRGYSASGRSNARELALKYSRQWLDDNAEAAARDASAAKDAMAELYPEIHME